MHELTIGSRPVEGGVGHPTASQRFGYVVAIGCNVVGLYLAHHLLDWGWPRFLTSAFDDVLPFITLSFVYGVLTNAVFVVYDRQWFKSLVNVIGSLIAFVVAVSLYVVYPFDFSDYAHDWSWAVTAGLILCMIATAVAAIAESARGMAAVDR